MEDKIKYCPFSNKECSSECAMYIHPDELNETVRNKLASLGVMERNRGICSLKNLALCADRRLFEETSGYYK